MTLDRFPCTDPTGRGSGARRRPRVGADRPPPIGASLRAADFLGSIWPVDSFNRACLSSGMANARLNFTRGSTEFMS